jgi:hypothetical protein
MIVIITIMFMGCISAGQEQEEDQFDVYILDIKTAEKEDVHAIAIEKNKPEGMASYTHDRYEGNASILVKMDFGTYKIEGNKITFISKGFPEPVIGEIKADRIIIGTDEFILH